MGEIGVGGPSVLVSTVATALRGGLASVSFGEVAFLPRICTISFSFGLDSRSPMIVAFALPNCEGGA